MHISTSKVHINSLKCTYSVSTLMVHISKWAWQWIKIFFSWQRTTCQPTLTEPETVPREHVSFVLCVLCARAPSPGLLWPAVPEQGSGKGLMPSEPTPPCTVTLNGHSVNPLKVHSPAAVDVPRAGGQEEQDEERTQKRKREKEKREGVWEELENRSTRARKQD